MSYVLSDSAWVEVDIEDSLGAIVRNLNAGEWEQEPGEHGYAWDGLSDASAPQPDGRYTLVVEADGRDRAELVIVLDTLPPLVGDLLVSPSRFTPDGDGVADSALVAFALTSREPTDRFWVDRHRPRGRVVARASDRDGRRVRSRVLGRVEPRGGAAPGHRVHPHGQHGRCRGQHGRRGRRSSTSTSIRRFSRRCTLRTPRRPRCVSTRATTPPSWAGRTTGPVSTSSRCRSTTARRGSARRLVPGSGRTRRSSGSTFSSVTRAPWGVVDGVTSVQVRAHDAVLTSDGLGHYNTSDTAHALLSFDVVFDVAGPVHDTTFTEADDATYESGQTIVITTEWDAPDYTIEADLSLIDSAVDSAFAMSGVSVTDYGTGRYVIEYTTSDGNTNAPVFDALVPIRATDGSGRVATNATVTVTVLESSGNVPGLVVDKNAFDPLASESVKISLGNSSGATVDIYNMAGTLVRALEPGGSSDVSWNGLNDEGEVVASGVYFLHISTESGDETRKVAVVK